jgi:AP-1-like transcription factor
MLRAQIEKMTVELVEYRKRFSLNGDVARNSSWNNGLPSYVAGKGLSNGGLNNPNDVNFQFEFPRFGRLPGPSILNGARQSASPPVTTQQISTSPSDKDSASSRNQSLQYPASNGSNAGVTKSPAQLDNGEMSSLSGLFSPSILETVGKSPEYDFFGNAINPSNGSRSSTDSANGNMSTGHNTSYSSPSASLNSSYGLSSPCGTSPEPSMQSPVYNKPADSTLTTIGEEHSGNTTSGEGELTFCDKLNMACGNPNNPIPRTMSEPNSGNLDTPSLDVNGIDWFAQQNGNQFDPQLFGDYREPQENILSGDNFADSFFSDAFAMPDFNSPFNAEANPAAPAKKHLVAQIDEKQNEDDEVVPGEDTSKLLTCNTIW